MGEVHAVFQTDLLPTAPVACQKPIVRYYGRRSFTTCSVSSLFSSGSSSGGSSGGLAMASESLCRGLGSGWFAEWFHGNALVTNIQYGEVFFTARHLKDYAVTRF